MYLKQLFLSIIFLLFTIFIFGQISQKGIPLSLTEKFLETHQIKEIPQIKVPLFNKNKFEKVKAKYPNFVFDAAGVDTKINMKNSGTWELMNDGSRIWRTQITASGAKNLTLLYDDFWLPEGSKFYLYTADENQILGAFTSENNKPTGKFSTATTRGESVFLEYYEPPKTNGEPRISINKVLQKLPSGRGADGEFGFNTSSDCHLNINCEQGDRFQEVKRGVVRIVMFLQGDEGTFLGYCTGAILNNTAQDQTPYLLTAFHCIIPNFTPLYDQWQFDFGYEAPSCDKPSTEPNRKTIIGAEMISGRQDPDFLLIKITKPIPSSFSPYYCGWNRAMEALPQKSGMVHHPCGDIKKITIDNVNTASVHVQSINWTEYTASPNTHFQLNFDEGFSQIGGSGSPIFDETGLVYGQLHGGNINESECKVVRLFYGRMAISWESDNIATRLKDWLDPLNSGVNSLEGLDPFGDLANFNGLIQSPKGDGIAGVSISIEGNDSTIQVITDANGMFNLQLPRTSDYRLTFSKSANPLNGVTTFDLIRIRQHILGAKPFDDNFQEVAGDANFSNSVTTFDILQIQKLILGISKSFPNDLSWGFVSPQGNLFNVLTLNDIQPEVNLSLIGLKIGDVNYSADPLK